MKRIVTLMLGVMMALQLWADNSLQAGQQVTIDNDCYATNLDKDTHAVVVKVQGKKAQIRLDNHMLWWVWTDSINLRNQ